MRQKRSNNYLQYWIEKLLAQGKNTFTYEQACSEFKDVSSSAITLALRRLSAKNKIVSVFKGFYVIISPEYFLKGIVPPILFIDSLMKYAGKPYYIGLLSAAALHGASHQRSQEFFVINQLPALRPTDRKGIKINYVGRTEIPNSFLEKRKTETGYVNISNPELTAIDLLQYEKHIGGVNRAATVINELSEVMRADRFSNEFISTIPIVMLQRLGFILDHIVENKELADGVFSALSRKYTNWERMPLKSGKPEKGCNTDSKWKIVINLDIEIDE